jgi:hypothetical protein
MVILSDLKNNVSKYSQYLSEGCLDKATVVVGAYEYGDPAVKRDWSGRFERWGADRIMFVAPEDMQEFKALISEL